MEPPAHGISAESVLSALSLVRRGQIVDLEVTRFPGMPQGPAHVPFQVITHRTPQGLRNQADQPWLTDNTVNFGWLSEVIIATTHTGTHMDALAHITVGEDDHWFGGNASSDLGDFGPMKNDASKMPALMTRGVLIDVPRSMNLDGLAAHQPVTASQLQAALAKQGTTLKPGDSVIVRTGQLRGWPDRSQAEEHLHAGIDLGGARFLADQGAVVIGSDGGCVENLPSTTPGNPHPVHIELLVERGIYILEMVNCEELANLQVYEFCLIALPLKIRGATGSMIRPIAIL